MHAHVTSILVVFAAVVAARSNLSLCMYVCGIATSLSFSLSVCVYVEICTLRTYVRTF